MRHFTAVLSLLVLVGACGKDSSTGPGSESIAGTYTLRTINGSPLPFVVLVSAIEKYEVLDDAITLDDRGNWTGIGHDRTTTNGVVTVTTITDAGTYVRDATSITFNSQTSGLIAGTIGGGRLTIADVGVSAVYVR